MKSCSSADEGESTDPSTKNIREVERRQANNVRERYVMSTFKKKYQSNFYCFIFSLFFLINKEKYHF